MAVLQRKVDRSTPNIVFHSVFEFCKRQYLRRNAEGRRVCLTTILSWIPKWFQNGRRRAIKNGNCLCLKKYKIQGKVFLFLSAFPPDILWTLAFFHKAFLERFVIRRSIFVLFCPGCLFEGSPTRIVGPFCVKCRIRAKAYIFMFNIDAANV